MSRFIYCLGDYEDSVWVTHEREMNDAELRALVIEHLRPLAAEQSAVEAEGVERFGKGAKFAHVKDGKVLKWSNDGNGEELTGADPVVFEEWQDRLAALQFSFDRMLAAAGFARITPTAGVFCPDRGPIETLERLQAE